MNLERLLAEKKSALVKSWFNVIAESYPADTSSFLKREPNPFSNPVGGTAMKDLEEVFDLLLVEEKHEDQRACLDGIIRIRAVQDFSPSQALFFVPALKELLREALAKENSDGSLDEQLSALDARLDRLLLQAFDIYVGCREKLWQLSATETRNASMRLLERFNLLGDEVHRPKKKKEKLNGEAEA